MRKAFDPPVSEFDDVGAFHQQNNLPNVSFEGAGPQEFDPKLMEFRVNFLLEELGELLEAMGGRIDVSDIVVAGSRSVTAVIPGDNKVDHAQAFDALIDLVYVAMGTAHLLGYPWHDGWDLVQEANMKKVRAKADGSDSKRGSSFDVVKPDGWTPPNIEALLAAHGFGTEAAE